MPLRRCALALIFCLSFLAVAAAAQATDDVPPAPATDPAAPAPSADAPGDDTALVSGEEESAPGPPTAPPDASSPPERTTRAAATLTFSVDDTNFDYGKVITASGVSSAGVAAAPLTVERQVGAAWVAAATDTTDAGGAWTHDFAPTASGTYRARMDDNSATSPTVTITVLPILTIQKLRSGPAFGGARMRAKVTPSSYTGKVRFRVKYKGKWRATISKRPSSGIVRLTIPTPGIGLLPVTASLPAASSLSGRTKAFKVRATIRTLRNGSRGEHVRALEKRLRQLRFHTPGPTSTFNYRMGDTVLAFHKSQRMNRNMVVSTSTWKRLALAKPMRPRYSKPKNHIEVDKRRQILMVVKNGKVKGTIHISSGATGNTPVGKWRVYQKGGSYLYKFMAFVGNFGIHGYVPVPAFPASHGCVREPMWTAAWTFANTRIGDRVYVY